jgi:hypothetical protein
VVSVYPFYIVDLAGTMDPSGWTPIAAPFDCDYLVVSNRNGGATLRVKGTVGDERQIPIGSEQTLAPPPPRSVGKPASGIAYRYPKHVVVGYLKPDAGVGAGMDLLWA